MEVYFKPSFIKDLKKLPREIAVQDKTICFNDFSKINHLSEFTHYPLRKMRGFKFYKNFP